MTILFGDFPGYLPVALKAGAHFFIGSEWHLSAARCFASLTGAPPRTAEKLRNYLFGMVWGWRVIARCKQALNVAILVNGATVLVSLCGFEADGLLANGAD